MVKSMYWDWDGAKIAVLTDGQIQKQWNYLIVSDLRVYSTEIAVPFPTWIYSLQIFDKAVKSE